MRKELYNLTLMRKEFANFSFLTSVIKYSMNYFITLGSFINKQNWPENSLDLKCSIFLQKLVKPCYKT